MFRRLCKNGNQASACHQLIREREKGAEWGRERRVANREGDDEGNHGYKDGGWRKGNGQPDRGWEDEQQDEYGQRRDYLQSVVVIMAWCVGRVFSDKETLRLRLPPLRNPPTSRRSYIHSSDRNRERQGGKDGSVAWALVCFPFLTR